MKKGSTLQLVIGRAVLMSVLALGVFMQASMQAQTAGKTAGGPERAARPGPRADKSNKADTSEPAGGPKESIQVHGHWVIDVRNPDGELVTHREFENSYQQFGILPNILSRNITVGSWQVELFNNGSPNGASYTISEPRAPGGTNLSVQLTGPQLVLSGSITMPNADTIVTVLTGVGSCSPSIAPQNCTTLGGANVGNVFSQAAISPISLNTGQIVQVTVTITFS